MTNLLRTLSVLLVAVLGWYLLKSWVAGGSERFYLVFPPACLTLLLVLSTDRRNALKSFLVVLAVYLVCLTVVCAGNVGLVPSGRPPSSGPEFLGGGLAETVVAAYFLTAMALVVVGFWHGLRSLGAAVARRLRGPTGRVYLVEITALFLLGMLALPYVLAVLYVHRLKIPNRPITAEPDERPAEEVEFATADGLTLRGWFFAAREDSARTLLICHGLGANRSMFLPYVEIGRVLKANVLLFDFRGHGASDGHTVTLGHEEKLDVIAAVHYLRGVRPGQSRQIVGLGISMGAASLARAAATLEPPLDAVILDSGFAAAADLSESVLWMFPAPARRFLHVVGIPLASLHAGCWLADVRPEDDIPRLRAPVLIIHAREDGLIPAEHAWRLYERGRPEDVVAHGHRGPLQLLVRAREEYLRAVKRLLEQDTPHH